MTLYNTIHTLKHTHSDTRDSRTLTCHPDASLNSRTGFPIHLEEKGPPEADQAHSSTADGRAPWYPGLPHVRYSCGAQVGRKPRVNCIPYRNAAAPESSRVESTTPRLGRLVCSLAWPGCLLLVQISRRVASLRHSCLSAARLACCAAARRGLPNLRPPPPRLLLLLLQWPRPPTSTSWAAPKP